MRYAIVLPDGKRVGDMTRREALDSLPWMPAGAKIDPPIPREMCETSRCLLDYLAGENGKRG